MTRRQRGWHRLIWPTLALLVGVSFVMALVLRPPPDPPQVAAEGTR
jgi:hypothetical protein